MAAVPAGDTATEAALALKSLWKTLRAEAAALAAGPTINTDVVYSWLEKLANRISQIATHAAVAGVEAAIRTLYPGRFADDAAVTSAIADFAAAGATLVAYIEDNLPQSASKRIQVRALRDDGSGLSDAVLVAASGSPSNSLIVNATQYNNFVAAIAAFRDSIDVS